MKKFIREIAYFLLIQAAILVPLFAYTGWNTDYLNASIDKEALLATAPSPRVIFVGGSNVAFGVDSQTIAANLARNPVNMGLHAGLGLEFMLREVESGIRKDDLIVMSLEYNHFAGLDGDVNLWNFCASQSSGKKYLGLTHLKTLLDTGLNLVTMKAQSLTTARAKQGESLYRRSGFSACGDMLAHRTMKSQGVVPMWLTGLNTQSLNTTCQRLEQFRQLCADRGATVMLAFPSIPQSSYDRNAADIGRIDRAVRTKTHLIIVDRPEDAILPPDAFYDSYYHLAAKGLQLRADHLSACITAALHAVPDHGTTKD
jgi:hypothetical protein